MLHSTRESAKTHDHSDLFLTLKSAQAITSKGGQRSRIIWLKEQSEWMLLWGRAQGGYFWVAADPNINGRFEKSSWAELCSQLARGPPDETNDHASPGRSCAF